MGKHLGASAILLAISTSLLAPPAMAQHKGEKAHKQAEHKAGKQGEDKAVKPVRDKNKKGKNDDDSRYKDKADRDVVKKSTIDIKAKGKFKRDIRADDLQPKFRVFALSKRAPERIAAGALARGIARGLRDD